MEQRFARVIGHHDLVLSDRLFSFFCFVSCSLYSCISRQTNTPWRIPPLMAGQVMKLQGNFTGAWAYTRAARCSSLPLSLSGMAWQQVLRSGLWVTVIMG